MINIIGSLGGRKFVYAIVITVVASIAFLKGLITSEQWVEIIKWTATSLLGSIALEDGLKGLNGNGGDQGCCGWGGKVVNRHIRG